MPTSMLLWEQDDDIAELLVYNFEQHGFAVHSAEGLIHAKEIIHMQSPKVVLLGTCDSGAVRAALCQWIRATPGMETSLILFLTTDRDCHKRPYNQGIGVDHCVFSPVKPQILLAKVEALMSAKFAPGDPSGRKAGVE